MQLGHFVDLVTDASRRDLSINAMATEEVMDGIGRVHHVVLHDPFGGEADIENKVLRHTSGAFMEDPVRVLRLARFRARFGPDWTVAKETRDIVHNMAKRGVLDNLQPDRIWKEMSRALMEDHPRLFFDTLLECDALQAVFPEIYKLKTALESMRWHPEGDAYEHTMLCLTQSAKMNYELDVRYAVLVHDLGKGLTPRDQLPKHYGHDVKGVAVVEEFSRKNGVPSKMRDHAKKACRYHMLLHKLNTLNAKTFVKMFDKMNVLNDPHSVDVLYAVGVCDERGRLGSEDNDFGHLDQLTEAHLAYKNVRFHDVFPNGETNPNKIQNGLRQAFIAAVANVSKGW